MKLDLNALSFESLAALPERERRMALAGLALAVAILVFGVLLPLDRSVAHARERLDRKQADLSWMQGAAPELAAAMLPPSTGESLVVIIDRSAREAGLASSLTTEPAGAGGLSVRLQKAPFDTMIAWLARLSQQNGVSIESATIEKADAAGLVNASVVLHSG
jgi:general secretion pathway protein M